MQTSTFKRIITSPLTAHWARGGDDQNMEDVERTERKSSSSTTTTNYTGDVEKKQPARVAAAAATFRGRSCPSQSATGREIAQQPELRMTSCSSIRMYVGAGILFQHQIPAGASRTRGGDFPQRMTIIDIVVYVHVDLQWS